MKLIRIKRCGCGTLNIIKGATRQPRTALYCFESSRLEPYELSHLTGKYKYKHFCIASSIGTRAGRAPRAILVL